MALSRKLSLSVVRKNHWDRASHQTIGERIRRNHQGSRILSDMKVLTINSCSVITVNSPFGISNRFSKGLRPHDVNAHLADLPVRRPDGYIADRLSEYCVYNQNPGAQLPLSCPYGGYSGTF